MKAGLAKILSPCLSLLSALYSPGVFLARRVWLCKRVHSSSQSPVSVKLVNTVYCTLARISEPFPGPLEKGGHRDASHAPRDTGVDFCLIGTNLIH